MQIGVQKYSLCFPSGKHLAPDLVQVGVVSPLVLRPVPLPGALTATGCVRVIDETEGAGALPRQAPEKTSVAGNIAILRTICRPEGFAADHQLCDRLVQARDVQMLQVTVIGLLKKTTQRQMRFTTQSCHETIQTGPSLMFEQT